MPERGRRVRRRDGSGAVRAVDVGAYVFDGVAAITGDNPPSPWNNADAFVATALYLKGDMTGCEAVYSAVLEQERCTAAKYYAGGDWKNYLWTYGEAVVEQAQSFSSDIQTITNGSNT